MSRPSDGDRAGPQADFSPAANDGPGAENSARAAARPAPARSPRAGVWSAQEPHEPRHPSPNTDGQSPTISLTQPQIGNPFTVGLTHAAINQPAVLWAALYTAPWTVNLRGLGAQGSFWYLDGGAFPVSPALVANNRQRSQAFWLPNDPILIGFPLAFQWQLATNSPANGWATSNAATCTIL